MWYSDRSDRNAGDLHKAANENLVNGSAVGYSLHPYVTSGHGVTEQSLYPHSSTAHLSHSSVFSALGGTLGSMGDSMKSVMPGGGGMLDGSGGGGALSYQQGSCQNTEKIFKLNTREPNTSDYQVHISDTSACIYWAYSCKCMKITLILSLTLSIHS